MTALAEGGSSSAAVLTAMSEKEKAIAQLERQLLAVPVKRPELSAGGLEPWVKGQLSDLVGLFKSDVPKVKAEFNRLNLALTFIPTDAKPRPHYVVTGQCDLSALAFSFVRPGDRAGLSAHRRLSKLGAVVDLLRGHQVQNRTPVLLGFRVELPSVEARRRWRERGRMARSQSGAQPNLTDS